MSQSPRSLAGRSCERGACGAGSAPQRHTARSVDTRTSSGDRCVGPACGFLLPGETGLSMKERKKLELFNYQVLLVFPGSWVTAAGCGPGSP